MKYFSPEETRLIQQIRNQILDVDPDAEIILYGSRARGDVHDESDWDILILLDRDHVSRSDEQPFRHRIIDIEMEYGQPISVFVLSKSDWLGKHSITPFYESVTTEGLIIDEKIESRIH
ncbi:MAG: nucleotidyltransferase domain-containing protein [Bacteroidales bacterium]